MDTDIRIVDIVPEFTELKLRTPLKFGRSIVNCITSATVKVIAENRRNISKTGYGNILLSDGWAFPSSVISHEIRDAALRKAVIYACECIKGCKSFMHPFDFFHILKLESNNIGKKINEELELPEQIPYLALMMCISPVDASIHDAFGNVNGICSYEGYGRDFTDHDLSYYIGTDFKGKYMSDYLKHEYSNAMPIFHLIGGLDKLTESEITEKINDGLPVSLDQWIKRDGLYCFKIKLSGKDIKWDIQRTADCVKVIKNVLNSLGKSEFYITTDSNELNDSPETVIEYLTKLNEISNEAYNALIYIEQPTERNILKHKFDMTKVSSLKPVLADEGLTGTDMVDAVKKLGWSGIALKTCKCHTADLFYYAKAVEYGMRCSVQDLTNVGYGLIHSAGLAARINTVKGFEYNSRQYIINSFDKLKKDYSSLFNVKDGMVYTNDFKRTGLY